MKTSQELEFFVFEPSNTNIRSVFAGSSNVVTIPTPIPSSGRIAKALAGQIYWPKALPAARLTLFENFSLPLISAPSARSLLTIHDIRRLQQDWPASERAVYRLVMERAVSKADHIITVSETMKAELLSHFPGLQVTVVYNGISAASCIRPAEGELVNVRLKYGLSQDFILSVGHLERRKNYNTLLKAASILKGRGAEVPLYIVGNDSGELASLRSEIKRLDLSKSVTILSGLRDSEVRCLYSLCRLFVFPSKYEGFGIPILEAMAAGVPMALADLSVFREITQNVGIYFPADNAEAMALAIERGLSDETIRMRLVEYGCSRVTDFSFPKLAAQVRAVYREIGA